MSRRRLQAPAPPLPPPTPPPAARAPSDLRHGGQYPRSHGQGRTQEADREHEVPGVHGALAPLQVHSGVSTLPPPPALYTFVVSRGAHARGPLRPSPARAPPLLTCPIDPSASPVSLADRTLRLCAENFRNGAGIARIRRLVRALI